MTFLDQLARALPGFQPRGGNHGVLHVGDAVAECRFEIDALLVKTADTDSCWSWLRRPGAAYPPTMFPGHTRSMTFDEIEVETLDPWLARAWIDPAVMTAVRDGTAAGAYALTDDRVELRPYASPTGGPTEALARAITAMATIATRPARLRREVDAAIAHLDTKVFGTSWALSNHFSVAILAHGVDLTLDWIRALPGEAFFDRKLRTRLRVAVDDPSLDLAALLAKHPARVAALDDATILRDGVGVAILRDGLTLDRTSLDTAIDLLVALTLDLRGAGVAGPYR